MSTPRRDLRFGESVVVYEFVDQSWPAVHESAGEVQTLRHPSLPEWWEVDRTRGGIQLVAGGVPGRTLSSLAAEGRLSVTEVARLLAALLGVLVEAHAKGVTHGNLGPDMIWVTGERLVVVGFGLRWSMDTRPPSADLAEAANIAWTLLLPGTSPAERVSVLEDAEVPEELALLLDALGVGAITARQGQRLLAAVQEDLATPTTVAAVGAPTGAVLERLFGRDAELDRLVALVSERHLVTVLGPGGMGKTRLARALLERRSGVFVDLLDARGPTQVTRAIIAALGFDPTPQDDPVAMLCGAVAGRPSIIVLDNAEQIVAETAGLIRSCLERTAELRFVVTSRVALDHPGEAVLELGPLPASDARELFLATARSRDGTYDPPEADLVAALGRLDGIPLAILLAASRAPTLGAEHVVPAGLGPRHGSMRSALDWSWSLLSEEERVDLLGLATFRGGCTLEQAERMLGRPTGQLAVETLARLRDASWVHELQVASGLPRRFGFFAPLQDDLDQRLAEWPLRRAAFERAHAEIVVDQAEALVAGLTRHGGNYRLRVLASEVANLEIAAHRMESVEPVLAARAWRAVIPAMASFGTRSAHLALTTQVCRATTSNPAWNLAARIDHSVALLRSYRYDEAADLLVGLIPEARASGDPRLLARSLLWLGRARFLLQDSTTSAVLLDEAADVAESCGDLEALVDAIVMRPFHLPHDHVREKRVLETVREAGYELGEAGLLHRGSWEDWRGAPNIGQLQRARELAAGRSPMFLWVLNALAIGQWACGDSVQALAAAAELDAFRAQRGFAVGPDMDLLRALAKLSDGDPEGAQVALTKGYTMLHSGMSYAAVNMAVLGAVIAAVGGRLQDVVERGDEAARICDPTYTAELSTFLDYLKRVATSAERPQAALRVIGEGGHVAWRSDLWAVFARALERWARASVGTAVGASSERTLWLGPKARWVSVDDQPQIDLSRRGPARRLMVRLAEGRTTAPGTGIDRNDLIEAGWPGERMSYEAGNNRFYVLLARLRREGLRELILTRDDGYLIDPSTRVVQVAATS